MLRSGRKSQTRRLPGETADRRSGNEPPLGGARTRAVVRPRWTGDLGRAGRERTLPAASILGAPDSASAQVLIPGFQMGTAIFRAELGLAVHSRVLPPPPSPASCPPAPNPGPTLEPGHVHPLASAVLPSCMPPHTSRHGTNPPSSVIWGSLTTPACAGLVCWDCLGTFHSGALNSQGPLSRVAGSLRPGPAAAPKSPPSRTCYAHGALGTWCGPINAPGWLE